MERPSDLASQRMLRRENVKMKEVSPMGQDEEPQHLCLSLLGLNEE